MQYAMLHFSVGFIWRAAQAEVHSSWTDVSCQRNMWTDHWRRDKEGRLGPDQDLSMGCSKGDCLWVQTQWHQVSRAQPLNGGKAERRIILEKHHSGEQGCQTEDVNSATEECDFYMPALAQRTKTTMDAQDSEPPLCTMSGDRYQKR